MIIALFTLLPLLAGAVIQYAAFRFTMRETGKHWKQLRLLRLVPLLLSVGLIALVTAVRLQRWRSEEVSPLTQIILIPGVPGICLLLGLLIGWQLFRRHWSPRIVRDRKN